MIDQGELFDIPNPCRGICTVNNKGYCKGCLRSRQERFHWNDFTHFQKQLIINLCERRRLKLTAGRARQVDATQPEETPQKDLFASASSATNLYQDDTHTIPTPAVEAETPPLERASRTTPQQASQIGLFDGQKPSATE